MQDKVQSENPKMSKTQVFSKCGEIWKELDPTEKEKYDGIYRNLQERYDHDLLQYQAALTNQQKEAIASMEAAKKKDRQNRKKKKARVNFFNLKIIFTYFFHISTGFYTHNW